MAWPPAGQYLLVQWEDWVWDNTTLRKTDDVQTSIWRPADQRQQWRERIA